MGNCVASAEPHPIHLLASVRRGWPEGRFDVTNASSGVVRVDQGPCTMVLGASTVVVDVVRRGVALTLRRLRAQTEHLAQRNNK